MLTKKSSLENGQGSFSMLTKKSSLENGQDPVSIRTAAFPSTVLMGAIATGAIALDR